MPFLGRHVGLLLSFWALNIAVVWRGIETIKVLERRGGAFMLIVGVLSPWWTTSMAGGFGPVLSAPSKFQSTGEFLRSSYRR